MRKALYTVAVALGLAALAGAGSYADDGKGVTIAHPWARATPGGSKVSAAFMEITSEAGDKLVGASSPAAGRVEVHTHIMDGEVMKMRRVDVLEIEPGKPRVLKPMGDHIMLMDIKEPLKEGGTLKVILTFEKAGAVEVEAPVTGPGAMGHEMGDHQMGDHKMGDHDMGDHDMGGHHKKPAGGAGSDHDEHQHQ